MKRILPLLLTSVFLFSTALAKTEFDLSEYSTAELRELSVAAQREALIRGEENNNEIPQIFIRIMNENGYDLELDVEKTEDPRNHAAVIRNLQDDAGEIYLVYGAGENGRSFILMGGATPPEYGVHCMAALFLTVLELEGNEKEWSFEETVIRILSEYEMPLSLVNLVPDREYITWFEGYHCTFEYCEENHTYGIIK